MFLLACGDDTSTAAGAGDTGAGNAGAGDTGAGVVGGSGSGAGTPTGGGGATLGTPYVYVGEGNGEIEIYLLDRATGALTLQGATPAGDNPSFLAPSADRRFLYAVDEGASEVLAFRVDSTTGALTEIGARQSSQGNGPAYVSVDASGKWALVANYGGGTVAVLPILPDGSLGPAVDVESPGQNPHSIRTDAAGTHAYVPCLGSDHVAVFDFDPATGSLDAHGVAALPAGTGPRHFDFHPTLPVLYVIGELGDTLTTFHKNADGTLDSPSSLSTLPNGADGANNACADLHILPGATAIYGSNRGHDSLAIFTLDAATGAPTAAGHQSTAGAWPRNFGLDPQTDLLLVANQNDDEIVAFAIDPATGALTERATTAVAAAPAWVGIVPQ